MGFIKEFFGYLIQRGMEDPEERDRKIHEHIIATKAKCEQVKEGWAHPVKPYGYWTTDKYNYKYQLERKISNASGRHNPWDSLSQSKLQKIVALSTTEAEYISASEASKEAIWLARLCSEFGMPDKAPMLGCDNQSAICLANNAMFHARTKHIDVRYHFIREVLEDGLITLVKSGHDGVWTIFRFSKQAHFIPVKKTIKPDHLARLFLTQIFRLHGMPEKSVSGRDPRFTSLFWKAIWENIGTRLQFTPSFHPQTDGQSEIANSVVLDLLKSYISNQKTQWERYLPLVEFAYNNTIHSSTGKTPFEIVEGAMKTVRYLEDSQCIPCESVETFGDVPDDGKPDEEPVVEENKSIFVPEQVLAHKVMKKGKVRRRFLVKFKNFPAFDAKWMEEEYLADTPRIVKLYLDVLV
ncbi:hypothetical protein L7F22_034971 [Adiantum nelumboides]|nr:hypothetical protein [Adiantum nelumboides]